ncbi:hypothetical protein SGPA1_20200 [Streptomyces misionensis JCM 4497]
MFEHVLNVQMGSSVLLVRGWCQAVAEYDTGVEPVGLGSPAAHRVEVVRASVPLYGEDPACVVNLPPDISAGTPPIRSRPIHPRSIRPQPNRPRRHPW